MDQTTPIAPRLAAPLTLSDTKQRVDDYIRALLNERIIQADEISMDYGDLWRSIKELFDAGGKRLRPYVLLLAYGYSKEDARFDDVLPAAAAQELLHLGVLIHDDIIDRDEIRYGVKNVTGQYNDIYKDLVTDERERLHFSRSSSILAGDLLISESYNLIQQCQAEGRLVKKAQAVLTRAIFSVVGGELLDTESAFRPFDEVDVLTIAKHKTASYSFVSPLSMGAELAGLDDVTIAGLSRFGDALGVAFQLQDDILGIFGNEQVTGKSTSGDIREGKHTYMVDQFYAKADALQHRQFNEVFGNEHATDEMINTARQLLVESGAKQVVETAIQQYAAVARQALTELSLPAEYQSKFDELIELCTDRAK